MPDSLLLPASYIVMAEAEPDLSTFENKSGLAEDMKFLASMPELCDVTFLVGDTREPVCAVKAVLAARSRVFHKMLYQVSRASSTKRSLRKSTIGSYKVTIRLFYFQLCTNHLQITNSNLGNGSIENYQ